MKAVSSGRDSKKQPDAPHNGHDNAAESKGHDDEGASSQQHDGVKSPRATGDAIPADGKTDANPSRGQKPRRRRNKSSGTEESKGPVKNPSSTTTGSQGTDDKSNRRRGSSVNRLRRRRRVSNLPCLYLGGLLRSLRGWELKRMVRDCAVHPVQIVRPPYVGYAFLYFETMEELQSAELALAELQRIDKMIRIELGRRSRTALHSADDDEEEEEETVI
jgi:hypothetical protein